MAQSTYRARITPRNAILHLRRLGRKVFAPELYKKNNPKKCTFGHKLGSVWNLGHKMTIKNQPTGPSQRNLIKIDP